MIFIVTALKSEAQAFVDRFKLQKSRLKNYTLFSNDTMQLIISGVGVANARMATQTLINHFDITDEDIYCNVGVCGASKKYDIGELLHIGAVNYHDILYRFDEGLIVTCNDEEVAHDVFEIVDMESYGFYDAVIHNPAIKKFRILKVVSDHFEPDSLSKDMVKSLIFNQIDNMELF